MSKFIAYVLAYGLNIVVPLLLIFMNVPVWFTYLYVVLLYSFIFHTLVERAAESSDE